MFKVFFFLSFSGYSITNLSDPVVLTFQTPYVDHSLLRAVYWDFYSNSECNSFIYVEMMLFWIDFLMHSSTDFLSRTTSF